MMRWSPFAFLFLIALVGCSQDFALRVESCAQERWNKLPEGDQTPYKALWDQCAVEVQKEG